LIPVRLSIVARSGSGKRTHFGSRTTFDGRATFPCPPRFAGITTCRSATGACLAAEFFHDLPRFLEVLFRRIESLFNHFAQLARGVIAEHLEGVDLVDMGDELLAHVSPIELMPFVPLQFLPHALQALLRVLFMDRVPVDRLTGAWRWLALARFPLAHFSLTCFALLRADGARASIGAGPLTCWFTSACFAGTSRIAAGFIAGIADFIAFVHGALRIAIAQLARSRPRRRCALRIPCAAGLAGVDKIAGEASELLHFFGMVFHHHGGEFLHGIGLGLPLSKSRDLHFIASFAKQLGRNLLIGSPLLLNRPCSCAWWRRLRSPGLTCFRAGRIARLCPRFCLLGRCDSSHDEHGNQRPSINVAHGNFSSKGM
jgi:hypothetical protein